MSEARKRSRSPSPVSAIRTKRLRLSSPSLRTFAPEAQDILSDEIFFNVLSFLTPGELVKMELVCRDWRRMSTDAQLWKRLYLARHPAPYTWPLAPTAHPLGAAQSPAISTEPMVIGPSSTPLPSGSDSAAQVDSADAGAPGSRSTASPDQAEDDFRDAVVVKGVDWKMLMKISSNWHNGNASLRTLSNPPSTIAPATPLTLPATETTSAAIPPHLLALSPSLIFTAPPSSPFVHVHLSSSSASSASSTPSPSETAPQAPSALIPPPPGWSAPSRPEAVTAICVDQSYGSLGGATRLAVFYRCGGYAVLEVTSDTSNVKGKSKEGSGVKISWKRIISYLPPAALRRRHRRRYHNVELEDEVTLAAFSWPILIACTKKFFVSTYQLHSTSPTSPAPDPVLLQTFHSPVSYHPATLSLLPLPPLEQPSDDDYTDDPDLPQSTTYRAALAYCTPLYPSSWTLSVQELRITLPASSPAQVERGQCWSVGRTIRPGQGIRWPFRAREEVVGVQGTAVGVGVDGKWGVLAGVGGEIQVFSLPLGGSEPVSGVVVPGIQHSQTIPAQSSPVTSISLAGGASPGRLLAGGGDGRVFVWELEEMGREGERLRREEEVEMGRLFARAGAGVGSVEVRVGGRRGVERWMTEREDGDVVKAIRKGVLPRPPSSHPLSLASAAREFFLGSDRRVAGEGRPGASIRHLAVNHDTIAGLVEAGEGKEADRGGEAVVRVWKFD